MSSGVSSPRRLLRRTDDRIVAGVASGVASYLGIDPVLVRVLFVLSVFAGGIGFIAYAAVWFLAPETTGSVEPATNRTDRNAGFWVAIALFVLGGLALADNVADRSLVWPVLLIGAGVALWRSDASRARAAQAETEWSRAGDDSPDASGIRPSFAHQVREEIDEEVAEDRRKAAARADRESAARRWQRRRSERDRSPLGGITFGSMLLVVGGMLLLDRLDVFDVSAATVTATALLILGVGLLIGSVHGHARWLAGPAVFLVLPLLFLTSFADGLEIDLTAGVGERVVVVDSGEPLADRYEFGIGEFVVDLGELDPATAQEQLSTQASLAIGQLTIVVPDDMTVRLDYEVALGAANLFGDTEEGGPDLADVRTFEGEAGGGRIELEADLGLGELVLVRDAVAPST